MKKIPSLLLALSLALPLSACGKTPTPSSDATELHVFAAASLTESMDQIITLYRDKAPPYHRHPHL